MDGIENLDLSPSRNGEHPEFIEHRNDQSIFHLFAKKWESNLWRISLLMEIQVLNPACVGYRIPFGLVEIGLVKRQFRAGLGC